MNGAPFMRGPPAPHPIQASFHDVRPKDPRLQKSRDGVPPVQHGHHSTFPMQVPSHQGYPPFDNRPYGAQDFLQGPPSEPPQFFADGPSMMNPAINPPPMMMQQVVPAQLNRKAVLEQLKQQELQQQLQVSQQEEQLHRMLQQNKLSSVSRIGVSDQPPPSSFTSPPQTNQPSMYMNSIASQSIPKPVSPPHIPSHHHYLPPTQTLPPSPTNRNEITRNTTKQAEDYRMRQAKKQVVQLANSRFGYFYSPAETSHNNFIIPVLPMHLLNPPSPNKDGGM